jgi:hypothetical protein
MAITRRERRELGRMSSRQLRSGGHLHTLPATRLSSRRPCRPLKTCQLRPHLVTHPNIIGEEATS